MRIAVELLVAGSCNRSDKVNLEDPAGSGTVVVRPTRMDTGIATDQLPVVHRQAMRVAGIRKEVRCLQHLASRGFVPHQTRPVLRIPLTVVAHDLPDGP